MVLMYLQLVYTCDILDAWNDLEKRNGMKIGFAQQKITPPHPCNLAGYAHIREMQDIHDDLYVKTFLFAYHEKIYGIVAYDLIAIDHLILDQVEALWIDAKLPIERLYAAAIHTHSGPMGILDTSQGFLRGAKDLMGDIDASLVAYIVSQTMKALELAYTSMEEGTLAIASSSCPGVGSNRMDKELKGNDDVFMIEALTPQKKAMITLFACHPTVLNYENTSCSADFPGAYAKHMEQAGYEMSLYLNGSCGDISTRFTRQSSGFPEVARIGTLLAKAASSLSFTHDSDEITCLKQQQLVLKVRIKQPKPIEDIMQQIAICQKNLQLAKAQQQSGSRLRLVENALEAAEADLRFAKHYDGQTYYPITIELLQVNREIFVGIPGELFSELSNPLQDQHTHFISYVNGYHMYFANQQAYDHQAYEAMSSPFAEGESEQMMDQIAAQIRKWRNEQ